MADRRAFSLRVDRKVPSGGSSSFYFLYDAAFPAVLPGAAFFTWAAERDSFLADALLSAYDTDDLDRDGFLVGSDCDDTNATIGGSPALLPGPSVGKVAGKARLTWTPPAGTLTDIAAGLLSSLRSTGNFSGATCLATGIAGTTFDWRSIRAMPSTRAPSAIDPAVGSRIGAQHEAVPVALDRASDLERLGDEIGHRVVRRTIVDPDE